MKKIILEIVGIKGLQKDTFKNRKKPKKDVDFCRIGC